MQSRPWTSLALIPAGEGAPEDFTVLVAVILSRTGMVHLGSPIQVADGGCAGLKYQMGLEAGAGEDDTVLEYGDVKVFIDAGSMVHLNGASTDVNAPFGGYKQSGNGREWGREGLREFLETKALMGYAG